MQLSGGKMASSKLSPRLLIGILIAVFFGVSLFFRIYLPYGKIFVGDWIKLSSIDAYFYTRLIDNMVHNFPHLTPFDPFFIYPGGVAVGNLSFYHWLQACFTWIIGLGSPTQHTVDVVGAYFPTILAALTVIPVYFIGKTLFNKWVGVLAAGLIAILPGEFLGRSILGAGDNPVAETLFTTTALLFLILAIKTAGQRQWTFQSLTGPDRGKIIRPLIYSLLAGIFLGMYLVTWPGALLFVFIITLYYIIQFIINHLKHKPSDHMCFIGFISFLVALVIFLPISPSGGYSVAMAVAVLIPLGLSGISRLISRPGLRTFYYPLSLIGIAVIFLGIFYAAAPGMFKELLATFKYIFFPLGSTATTTIEMQPFLSPQGEFSTLVAWGNFTTNFFIAPWWLIPGLVFAAICGYIYYLNKRAGNEGPLLVFFILATIVMIIVTATEVPSNYSPDILFIPGVALISLSILIYLFVKRHSGAQPWSVSLAWVVVILMLLSILIVLITYRDYRYVALLPFAILVYILMKPAEGDEDQRLFIVWTLLILIVAMIQRRFAYYLVVNIALLSGYLGWQVIRVSGAEKLRALAGPERAEAAGAGKKKQDAKRGLTIYHLNTVLAVIVVLLFVCPSTIVKAKTVASLVSYAPTDGWQTSLLWMKDNTPEPMGDPDAYYKLYEAPPPGEDFPYPDSAYGVTSWWDYGYWITRIAHRIPSANPAQSPEPIKKVARLFLSDNESAPREIMAELESSYIILDYQTCTSKLWAVGNWAGEAGDKFFGVYYLQYQGQLVPVQVFHLEYYNSLCVRLYNFDGKAVTDVNPVVITYQDSVDSQGNRFLQITDFQDFDSYQEAVEYVESDKSVKRKIVGNSPFISPVPLEAVADFRLIHSSETGITDERVGLIPEVKIFEYSPR